MGEGPGEKAPARALAALALALAPAPPAAARIRSLKNEVLVGDVGSLARDTALEAEIHAALTAAKGISSVTMRWNATGGHVVLMGVAQSAEEAAAAVARIRGIGGVKGVKSHLRVVAPAGK